MCPRRSPPPCVALLRPVAPTPGMRPRVTPSQKRPRLSPPRPTMFPRVLLVPLHYKTFPSVPSHPSTPLEVSPCHLPHKSPKSVSTSPRTPLRPPHDVTSLHHSPHCRPPPSLPPVTLRPFPTATLTPVWHRPLPMYPHTPYHPPDTPHDPPTPQYSTPPPALVIPHITLPAPFCHLPPTRGVPPPPRLRTQRRFLPPGQDSQQHLPPGVGGGGPGMSPR